MFKAAVFVVVLTLVGGRSATLLCGSWCDRSQVPSTCYHDETTRALAAMSGADGCNGSDLVAGLWREGTRRVAPGHEQDLQLPSSAAQLLRPADTSFQKRTPAWMATPPARQPLSTQLRI